MGVSFSCTTKRLRNDPLFSGPALRSVPQTRPVHGVDGTYLSLMNWFCHVWAFLHLPAAELLLMVPMDKCGGIFCNLGKLWGESSKKQEKQEAARAMKKKQSCSFHVPVNPLFKFLGWNPMFVERETLLKLLFLKMSV